jgi:hypothetical protein
MLWLDRTEREDQISTIIDIRFFFKKNSFLRRIPSHSLYFHLVLKLSTQRSINRESSGQSGGRKRKRVISDIESPAITNDNSDQSVEDQSVEDQLKRDSRRRVQVVVPVSGHKVTRRSSPSLLKSWTTQPQAQDALPIADLLSDPERLRRIGTLFTELGKLFKQASS